jgi:hypothetical protein
MERDAPFLRMAMLDGDRYYDSFPDERPAVSSLQALLDALAKLEEEFRKYLEQAEDDDPPK